MTYKYPRSSQTVYHGQEFWQILAQWIWNQCQPVSHQWQPTPMRQTEFASAQTVSQPLSE
jgi:hypothetical protein